MFFQYLSIQSTWLTIPLLPISPTRKVVTILWKLLLLSCFPSSTILLFITTNIRDVERRHFDALHPLYGRISITITITSMTSMTWFSKLSKYTSYGHPKGDFSSTTPTKENSGGLNRKKLLDSISPPYRPTKRTFSSGCSFCVSIFFLKKIDTTHN